MTNTNCLALTLEDRHLSLAALTNQEGSLPTCLDPSEFAGVSWMSREEIYVVGHIQAAKVLLESLTIDTGKCGNGRLARAQLCAVLGEVEHQLSEGEHRIGFW